MLKRVSRSASGLKRCGGARESRITTAVSARTPTDSRAARGELGPGARRHRGVAKVERLIRRRRGRNQGVDVRKVQT